MCQQIGAPIAAADRPIPFGANPGSSVSPLCVPQGQPIDVAHKIQVKRHFGAARQVLHPVHDFGRRTGLLLITQSAAHAALIFRPMRRSQGRSNITRMFCSASATVRVMRRARVSGRFAEAIQYRMPFLTDALK
jgi:hypothetical protein